MPNLEKLEIVLERIVFTPECKWVYQLRFKLDGREFAISKELPEAAAIDLNMASSQPSGNSGQFKWIPVTERLPDLELAEAKANDADFYPCLVVIKHPKAKGGRYVSKCWYNGYDFLDTDECPWTSETTHWMPLPEPPKGE